MDNLKAKSPCDGLLPLNVGAMTLEECDMGQISSIAPFKATKAAALTKALGMAFPEPLQTTSAGEARCVWAGQGEALLMGRAPDAGLGALAAVVDQSDAWATVTLTGPQGADVLARLVPVDMRETVFGVGATARTQLGHMNASITRLAPDVFLIAVFRSMAGTLVHDLTLALEAVAARG